MNNNTGFNVTLNAPELRDAITPALEAAKRAYAKDGADRRGVVIGQLYLHDDGRVEVRGSYIEHEYALPIFNALEARRDKNAESSVSTGEKQ